MNCVIRNGKRSGEVTIPSSKSEAHRFLLAAALSDAPSVIICRGISKDIAATIGSLRSLGAEIEETDGRIGVRPIGKAPKEAVLHVGESGSTLRFLLPVAGSLGVSASFVTEGRLSDRPLGELLDTLEKHGMTFEKEGNVLRSFGKLSPGDYEIAGNVSSQYITGLLFALPLLSGDSSIRITTATESAAYIEMTEQTLRTGGIRFERLVDGYRIPGEQVYHVPENITIGGDWSNAAFFLAMGALSEKGITVNGCRADSLQGDRKILGILREFGANVTERDGSVTVSGGDLHGITIDASEIPDLVMPLSVVAAVSQGVTDIVRASRLRYKESDRLKTTAEMLSSLGADVTEKEDGLRIIGKACLSGGTADPANDHRIAMAAALAACVSEGPVTVTGAECVAKSFPDFFETMDRLEVTE